MSAKIGVKTLKRWNELQMEEVLSSKNRWLTGINVGHKPDFDELWWHYVQNGGSEDFAKTHEKLWVNGRKKGGQLIGEN